jgi:hypothetical protein
VSGYCFCLGAFKGGTTNSYEVTYSIHSFPIPNSRSRGGFRQRAVVTPSEFGLIAHYAVLLSGLTLSTHSQSTPSCVPGLRINYQRTVGPRGSTSSVTPPGLRTRVDPSNKESTLTETAEGVATHSQSGISFVCTRMYPTRETASSHRAFAAR